MIRHHTQTKIWSITSPFGGVAWTCENPVFDKGTVENNGSRLPSPPEMPLGKRHGILGFRTRVSDQGANSCLDV